MRTTILRLALLGGAVAALPAVASAQPSPATPDRDRPAAATEGTSRPGTAASPGTAVRPGTTGPERADSVRPDAPNQGATAGQGTAAPGMPATRPGGDVAGSNTGRTDPAAGATTPGARSTEGGSGQAAVRIDEGTRIGTLESGANSFTEGQARTRIEAAGFTNLQELRKDGNGIWRGRAMQGGQQVDVGLDYRGNVGVVTR